MTTSPRQYTTSPESTPLHTSFAPNPLPDPPRKSEGWAGRQRNWIPDPRDPSRSRTLILCFDGTGDQFDNDNSNIVQLMALLKKDSQEQRVYYQTGVGTYKGPSSRAPGVVSKVLDLMLANTLGAHVRDGYEFLMENYCLGDKICLFGFSRGAYTARALAGMLSKVGLLPSGNKQQIPFAYHMYSRQDPHALSLCKDFKRTYGIDVKIEFCGVWDTVASVGIIPKSLPFVATNNGIRFFRHALALDEHRSKFMPNFYKAWKEEDLTAGPSDNDCDDEYHEEKPSSSIMRLMDPPKRNPHPVKREHSQAWLLEYDLNSQSEQKTDSLEVFFAGSHADVGGGSVENNVKHSLARIPLRWMIRECFKAQTGIIFDMDMLQKEIGIDIDAVNRKLLQPPERVPPHKYDFRLRKASKRPSDTESYNGEPQTQSVTFPRLRTLFKSKHALPLSHTPETSSSSPPRPMNEAEEELQDALSPIYDQLQLEKFWWILEICPLKQLKQQAIYDSTDNTDDFFWMVNRGKGRKVFKHVVQRGIKVHRSVLTRLEALDENDKSKTYIPRIRPNIHAKQDGKDVHMHFRCMTHEEWVERRAPGVDNTWFEWVE